MTNRLKYSLAAGLVALTVAAMAPLAMAQDEQARRRGPGPGIGGPPPGGPGMRGGAMMGLRGLDLTEAQQDQVKSIMDSHQTEFSAVNKKIGEARQAMRALLDADQIDESAIRAKSAEAAAAEADAAILQAKIRREVFGILTAEQLQKAKENKGPRQRRGQWRSPWLGAWGLNPRAFKPSRPDALSCRAPPPLFSAGLAVHRAFDSRAQVGAVLPVDDPLRKIVRRVLEHHARAADTSFSGNGVAGERPFGIER